MHSGRLLVRFGEVLTRDVAETLRGALLVADTATLPPTGDPEEFYDHELEGLRAELTDGTVVGKVLEVLHSPGGELLAVKRDKQTLLIPFVHAIVPVVDIAGGRVVLDPPEGLLDVE
jgi:16S rRNA processing protein RimM